MSPRSHQKPKQGKIDPSTVRLGEVYIEYTKVGQSWRISAIDPDTRMEVSMAAPPSYTRKFLERLIIQKLKYAIAKHRSGQIVPQARGWEV